MSNHLGPPGPSAPGPKCPLAELTMVDHDLFTDDMFPIMDAIAGFYSPGECDSISINKSVSDALDLSEYTVTHESTHRSQFTGTSYGVWQVLVHQVAHQLSSRKDCVSRYPVLAEAQRAGYNASWNSHEGVATFCGMLYQASKRFMGQGCEIDSKAAVEREVERIYRLLPRSYACAVDRYTLICKSFCDYAQRDNGFLVQTLLPNCVSSFCLNTSIIDASIDSNLIYDLDSLGDYFSCDGNVPDRRLDMLLRLVMSDPANVWRAVVPVFNSCVEKWGEYANDMISLSFPVSKTARRALRLYDSISSEVGATIASVCGELEHVNVCHARGAELAKRIMKSLAKHGIDMDMKIIDLTADRNRWLMMQYKRTYW